MARTMAPGVCWVLHGVDIAKCGQRARDGNFRLHFWIYPINLLPMISSTEKLLAEIERFLTRTGMNATDFGHQAVGDVAFVHRLRAGKDTRLKTADRVRAFMESNKTVSGKPRPRFRGASAAA